MSKAESTIEFLIDGSSMFSDVPVVITITRRDVDTDSPFHIFITTANERITNPPPHGVLKDAYLTAVQISDLKGKIPWHSGMNQISADALIGGDGKIFVRQWMK